MIEKNFNKTSIAGLPIWFFIIPPVMLLFSSPIFDWPYGYYQFLRIIVCGAAMLVAFSEYKESNQHVAACAVLIALIYNPLLKIDLDKTIREILNFGISGLWIYFLWKKGLKVNRIMLIFGIPLGLVVLAYIGVVSGRVQEEREYQIEKQRREAIREKIDEEKKAKDIAEERGLIENVEKIDLIKFELIKSLMYERDIRYIPSITVKNKNSFSIYRIDARIFFVNKDGALIGQEELVLLEQYSDMKILEANAIAQISANYTVLPKDADFQQTKLKILKAYRLKEESLSLFEKESFTTEELDKLEEFSKEMESAAPLSKD